jgi:membrane protein
MARHKLTDSTRAARFGRWRERGRDVGARVEAARPHHAMVDFGLTLFERDASIGGGLLAGALAYRLFVLLLPTALLFVSGLGLYADAADKSTSEAAKEAGLHGLIASQVASASAGGARLFVFILMVPAVLYATATLYRALAIVHGIIWHGSGRGARPTPRGIGMLLAALLLVIAAAQIVGWIRRHDQLGGLASLLVYFVLAGGGWLLVSLQLPHRDAHWQALLPGAALVGVGLLFVNVFNLYVTTRLVEGRADTYGALGIATALLLSLVIVGRLMVLSAEVNALLAAPEEPA